MALPGWKSAADGWAAAFAATGFFFVPGKNGESKVQMDGADMGKPESLEPTFWGESNP